MPDEEYDDKNKIVNFGTREWSNSSINFLDGCSHDCLYCYAKSMAIRFRRKTPDTWKEEVLRKIPKYKKKKDGRVMIPSTHDITPRHLPEALTMLNNLLSVGNELLVVSKPHLECIKAICDSFTQYKGQILFRFTIGSVDSETLKYWEPNAPRFEERFESLKYAYNSGYETSISSEPMLDMNIRELVTRCQPYITNAIWIGRFNKLTNRLTINGCDETVINKGRELLEKQNEVYILGLYEDYKDNPVIKWKDSLKKIVGMDLPAVAGLDM